MALMLENEFVVAAPTEPAWQRLLDLERVARFSQMMSAGEEAAGGAEPVPPRAGPAVRARPPTAGEVPFVWVLVTEDAPSPLNPLGVKGSGEGGTAAVGAALANAVSDALGVEVTRLPLTPERVLVLAGDGGRR